MSEALVISVVRLENDNHEVIEFLKENVQPLMSPEVYKWEYFFEQDEALFITANKKDQVVCTQSFLPYYLKTGKEVLKTSKSENSFMSSEYRGTSLFKDVYDTGLNACKEKNQKIVWGFTPAAKVWRKKLGFFVDEDASFDFRTVINFPSLNSKSGIGLKSILKYGYNLSLYLIYSMNRLAKFIQYKKEIQKLEVHNSPKNYQDIDKFYSSILPEDCISLLMNETYIKWRIIENPNLIYTTRYFYSDDKLLGLYIYSINQKTNSDCAHLSELIAVDDTVKSTISAHLLKSLKKETIVYMEYFGNMKNALIKRNFDWLKQKLGGRIIPNKNFSFVAKSLDENTIADSSKWYFNALWTEGFDR